VDINVNMTEGEILIDKRTSLFRRVSTTLRQVLTEFSEFFKSWVFRK